MGKNDKVLDALWGGNSGSWRQGKAGSSAVDDSYVDQFIADANSYVNSIEDIVNGITYKTARNTSFAQSQIADDLQNRADQVISFLDENRDRYDPEGYQSLRTQIENFRSTVEEGRKAVQSARDYYAQWDTEDAYNQAMQESSWVQKYQGKGYQELVPLLEGLEDGDEKNWLTEYADYVDYNERINMDFDSANQEIQALQDQLNRAKNLEENYNEYRNSPLLMLTQGDTWRDLEQRYDAFVDQYGGIERLQANIDQKRQRMAESKQLQDSIRQAEEYEQWKQNVRDPKLVQQELDRVNQALALNQQAIRNANRGSTQQDMAMRKEADAGRQALEQQRTALEQELQYGRMQEYAALMQRSDFEKNSQYTPSGDGMAIRDNATGQMVNTGFRDIEYDYVNKNPKAEAYQGSMDSVQGLAQMGLDRSWLLQLTEDEVKVYNYLYHTEGRESAREYLQVMRSELNRRQRAAEETKWAQYAQEHPWKASAASVVLAPMKAIGAMGAVMDQAADGRIDQNAAYNRASHVSAGIRDQVIQEIQKNEKWGQVGAFGYQTAMSMGDFLMNGVAGGGLFGVPGVTLAIMGSGAAADTVISAKDRGIGDAQAFGMGIVAGLAEALTERFSLEALLDADLLKNGIGTYVLKNSLTEGSEEVASSIINLWADIEATKEKSEWQQAIRAYQDMGYSEEEAFAKAMADQAASMGMDFLGGVISGGVLSGATSAQYKASTAKTGRAMGRNGLMDPDAVQNLLDAGANAEQGTAANAVAARLQKKLDAGKQLTAFEKGQLYQSNPQAVSEAVFSLGSVQLADPMVKGIDNKSEDWQQAQRLAAITSRDIRFYNGDPEEDGYYDRKTGEIFINVDRASEHQAAYVFSHELTHSTELGDSYQDLRNYIKGKLTAEGRDWNLMMRRKADVYANAGHALESNADIEAEIVAQYVQENLLTNEQELFDLFWAEPTIGQKILNWFDNLLAKYRKNDKSKERIFIQEARQKVLRAWESSNRARKPRERKQQEDIRKTQDTARESQYSPEDLEALDQMYQGQYQRGEITEEEYDEYLAWRDHETAVEEGAEELGRQYSFAGPKAKTADQSKFQQAKQMESDGVDNETIRQQTGWFRGMDGKWRFEIDDSTMKYHRNGDALFSEMHPEYARHQELMQKWLYGELDGKEKIEFRELDEVWGREHQRLSDRVRRGNATLQNILHHDELFEAYPELRGAKVIFENMDDGKRGQYDPNTNTITLSNTLRNAPQETLLHEVQHAIQSMENFTGGASIEYWKEKRRDIVETIAGARKNLDLWLADIGYPEVNKQSLLKVSRREKTLEQHWKDMKEFKEKSEFARQIAACEAEIAEFQKHYDEITNGMTAYEQYENTAGEIEARDTANRWKFGLDEEGRKNTSPDLGDDRTVFAEGTNRIYQERRLTEGDLEDYLRAGNRGNKNKLSALQEGQNIILTSAQQIKEFIRNAIDRTLRSNTTVAYGKVNDRLASDVQRISNGKIEIKDNYLELIPDNLQHAYEQHHIAKQPGDIDLTRTDFENIPEYLDSYTEIVYAIKYASGKIGVCVSKKLPNGRILLIETVSKSRGSLQFKNAIGVSEGKYQTDYAAVYKKKAGTNTRGSDSSNDSLHDGSSSDTSIVNPAKKVNKQFSINAEKVNKRDVASDLRAILSRGGDPTELQKYVDSLEQSGRNAEQKGVNRYQTAGNRNSTARDILGAAHSQGMGVEEYLRWNPEQFERNGKWRPEALEAMRLEQGGRRYSMNAGKQGQKPEQNLSFLYEPVNPRNSYFSTDGGGDYGLYADGTVIPNGDTLEGMNELTGWRDQGLFAMYTVILDGRELDPQVQLPGGYFTVAEIIEHPKVKQSAAGYVIAEKGRIIMTDDSQTAAAPAQEEAMHSENAEDEEARRERDFYDDEKILEESGKLNSPEMKALLDRLQSEGNPRQSAEVNQEKAQQEGRTEPHQERKADSRAESQAHVIQREHLPTKARSYLARAESNLLNSIGKALSVPRYARYNNLMGIIQEISDVYLAEGTISDEKLEELFDKAYAEGIVADSEFYDQYKEIKDHLRTYGVTLSERDRSDIADFDDFRKRAFGTLRILNEGGVPVDTAYAELHTMAPELFPESITHPADQLVRMFEVGQSIAISKKSLDEYYGPERDEFRRWAKNDFDAAVGDAFRDLRQVRRYAEEEGTKEETRKILTTEEAEEAFQELKKLRRNVDKVRAKNLLTESDEILLGRMLKGEIGPQHLNPKEDNVKGITALYEAKLAYESQVELLAAYKRSVRAKRLQDADRYLETATGWKDKRAGILYARETMRRNILDIVPDKKLAEQIAEHYFEAVHISEAKSTKFKTEYRDRVRALNLSTKVMKGNMVSEAHAVQLLGEAMDNIRVMENARGRMGMRDGKTLAEWRAVVDDLWINNTGLDRQKVERAVEEFRKIYDELFQQMNRVRVENGYEPVNYRQGYFPHFQPGGDGIMGFFGKVMGINTQVDALPTTINGLTHTFKPGIQWFGNAQERIGFNTAYDAVEGFDRYIEGVASVIFQTENIQKLRALATQARYRTSDEGIRKQVDAVRMDDRLTEEEKQREINAIYEHGRFALSNFVAELDEYTNLLANKKSKYDRTMESLIGRRAYMLMKNWENRVGANMIAGNISSAMTNFIPLTQASAQLDSGMILKGMLDTLRNIKQGDSLAATSDFLTNRRGSDPLAQTWMQKTSAALGMPMTLVDNFTSESIVRAAYMQNLKRGLSEAEAMHQADIFAAGVMADRSKGAMPTLFESRNPLFKSLTMFQLEVNNQFSEVFKDLPRNHREKGLAVLAMVLLKYFLGALLYNDLFEKLVGRRSALDPIDMLNQTVGDLTGYEIPNLFNMASDLIHGEDISFETEKVGIGQAGTNLATSVLSELPFSAGLNMIGIETDGGRLPAASAVPDFSAIWQAATDGELTGDQRWKKLQDELNKLAYVLPPFGGGQASKSWKGIKAYIEGGSYSLDREGNEILQYPIYKVDPDDAFWSLVRAAFMGKNSLPEAQDWVENGYNSLNQYETEVYKDLLNCGVKDRDAYDLVDQLRNLKETETEDGPRRAEGRRILARSNISAEGKAAAFYGMVATKKEREWMDKLVDAGVEQASTMAFVSNLYDTEKLRGTEKKQEQLRAFLDAPLTDEEKMVAVGFIMDTAMETESGNPTQYAKFLTAISTGLTVDKYMEIRATETDIEDYLELTDIGIKGEKAADLAIAIDSLEPGEGYDSVTWIQRSRTIMDSDLTEQEQMAALQTVMYESTYEKVEVGHNCGMNVKSYIDLKSIMPEFDANGNGSYSQQETEDAINALAGDDNVLYALTGTTPNGYTLTDREKAILWQLQNKSWKPKRNPFDKEVGQMVYDILTAEDPEDAEASADSGNGFDVGSLLALMK